MLWSPKSNIKISTLIKIRIVNISKTYQSYAITLQNSKHTKSNTRATKVSDRYHERI